MYLYKQNFEREMKPVREMNMNAADFSIVEKYMPLDQRNLSPSFTKKEKEIRWKHDMNEWCGSVKN